jgi:hypothetical protein
MPRGLSTILKTEIAKQSIKAIALVQIKFPTTQRFTNHYKDIEVSELWDDALGLWDDRNPTGDNDIALFSYSLDSQTAGFPILSNTQSKTGTTSAYFGSTNNEIQIPQEQDVIQSALSANNQFTIEFWYYIETATLAPRFISVQQNNSNSTIQLSIAQFQGQIFVRNHQGVRIQAGSVSDQTWRHIALTADNGTLKLYIDGVLEGTSTGTTFIDAQSEFNIGGTGPWSSFDSRFHINGYMDLFRVSNSVRYTTNFTPPTSAFTVDDNTTIIFNFDGSNGSQDFELLQILYPSTGLWNGGITYSASSHLLRISAKTESSSLNVNNFSLQLSAVESTFTSIMLNNNVSNDEVAIDIGFIDSNEQLIDVFNYAKGFIDGFTIDTKNAIININCTSHFGDFSRVTGRKTNEGSHKRFFENDGDSFEFSSQTIRDLKWGRA